MADLTTEIQAEIKAIRDQVSGQFEEKIRELDAKAEKRWQELQTSPDAVIGESLKSILDDRLKAANERADAIQAAITDRLDEMEAKAKERGASGYDDPDRALNEAVKGFTFKPRSKSETADLTVPLKAVVTITNANANGEGFADRQPGIREYPQRPLYLRQLILPGSIDNHYLKYERELAGSQEGGADYQGAEGDVKPTMDIYTEMVTAETATIAVTSRVSTQIFDDRSAFISFLRGRMAYEVSKKLDGEILDGAGGSNELDGIKTNATPYGNSHAGHVTAVNRLDVLRFAKYEVGDNNYVPDFTVLNTLDWAIIETLKDGDERYLIGDPRSGNAFRGNVGTLWGMNVVAMAPQTEGEFTVGDGSAAQLFMRQELELLASTEDQDNFVRNLVTLRAELRALLAIYSELAFVDGAFAGAIAAT